VQRVWLQVALAAGAGLGSLAVCCAAVVVFFLLLISSITFGGWGGSSLDPTFFWFGVVTAMILLVSARLSLPALALGAGEGHALKTTVLSSLVFGPFVFLFFLSLDSRVSFPAPLISLMALVGTSAMGSLVAVREEGHIAVRLGRVTVIVAVAIYCASLIAYWLVPEDDWPRFLAPYVVAASSWPVLPAIGAMLGYS
jgi:hypothetical protein